MGTVGPIRPVDVGLADHVDKISARTIADMCLICVGTGIRMSIESEDNRML